MVLLEERDKFFLKRLLLVMFILVRNVSGDGGYVGFAHAEHAISGLPGEFGMALVVNPFTGIGLDDTYNFGNRMRGTNTNEHMNMIGHAVDNDRRATHFADNAAKVGEYIIADVRRDERQPLFGREDQVDNDVAAGLGHGSFALSGLGDCLTFTQGEAQRARLTLGCILLPLRGCAIVALYNDSEM